MDGGNGGRLELLRRQQAMTEKLASATTRAAITDIVVAEARAALGAAGARLTLFDLASRIEISDKTSRAPRPPAVGPGRRGPRLSLPLQLRRRVAGELELSFDADGVLGEDDWSFAESLARQCSVALERHVLLEERSAGAAHLEALQRVTAGLAWTMSRAEASAALVDVVALALGCPAGWLAVLSDDGTEVSLVHARGKLVDAAKVWRRFSVTAPGPVNEVLVGRTPLFFRDARSYAAVFPDVQEDVHVEGYEAVACLPIDIEGAPRAVLGLRFAEANTFDEPFRALLAAIAAQCAQALERARLFEAERRARAELSFLLEANRLLSSSLDLRETLGTLAALVVPTVADWCGVEMKDDDGVVRQRALAHKDPQMLALLRELREKFPPDLSMRTGASGVMSSGEAAAAFDLGEAQIARDAHPPELIRGLHLVGLRSTMAIPLTASGQVVGAIFFGRGPDRDRFTASDFALAKEIGTRASTAIDNAQRHQQVMRAREEAERAREEAERASRVKDEFLALLGHELRNPLMPIMTALEVMKMRDEGGHEKETAIIGRQARHLLRLVDDLLDVARVAQGRVALRLEDLDMCDVVARALEVAAPALEGGRHRVSVDVARGLRVHGDPHRLVQVLVNLLTNASRYTPPGGHVQIRVARDGGQVVVVVRDNGRGLCPDMLPRVFDLFVQGERSIDRAEGGLGLGLSIVKHLVELHHGTVIAESEGVGRGSAFTVRLPLAGEAEAPHPTMPRRPTRRSGIRKRVLVVDDNEDLAIALSEALEETGHDVRVAHDGPTAIHICGTFKPQVALMDIGLPGMDGYELCQKLRGILGGETRFIAITGYGQLADRERALRAGFHEHRVKPVGLDEILMLIDAAAVPQETSAATS